MRVSFHGAAGEVTGSCTLVETGGARVLVDFGLHQGGPRAEVRNRRVPRIRPEELDAVVLTHAHIDHSGRLPLLPGLGYRGVIYATPASIDLCGILLKDAANLQGMDAERTNRRRARVGRAGVMPLFGQAEVERVMSRLRPLSYGEGREIAPGVRVRLHDAGHILGSAWVEMEVAEGGSRRVLVFSGDIGSTGSPLLRDAEPPAACDLLVMESTYGDRDHRDVGTTLEEFAQIARAARTPQGKVLIPAFAVGRTQQLIYHIGRLARAGRIESPRVYVDSPMGISATELYLRHRDLFDDECLRSIQGADSCLSFPGLRLARTSADSQAINRLGDGVMVIAGSGMCNGGRIVHHLRHGLWREETHVVFVGFQAEGTLGRRIVDRERMVSVQGERIRVNAQVHTLGGFSAHAGRSGLMAWAGPALASRPRVALNHGEDSARDALARMIGATHGLRATLPVYGEVLEL